MGASPNAPVQIEAAIEPVAQRITALQQWHRGDAGGPVKGAERNVIGEVRSAAAQEWEFCKMRTQRRECGANRRQMRFTSGREALQRGALHILFPARSKVRLVDRARRVM